MKITGIPIADVVLGVQNRSDEEQGNVEQCHFQAMEFLRTALKYGQYPTARDVVAIFKVSVN